MANIQPTVDALDEPTVMLQIRKIAGTVDSNLEAVNNEMAQIQESQQELENKVEGFQDSIDQNTQDITAIKQNITSIEQDITAVENKNTEQDSAISENENAIQSEIVARQNADITASELLYSEGVLTLKLTRQSGDIQETVDVPFFKTVTLIPTSTERAFKLQFTMWDDTVYDTNEFVIPAGGGTEVSVTGVTIGEGASDNSFKVSIQLSDASTIASNDYPFPESVVNPYPTSATLALSGNTLNLTIGLSNSTNVQGSVDLSPILASYATQAWVTGQLANYATNEDLEEIQVQITGLALTSSGNTMSINGTSATIINSISGQVTDGNLKIIVNGVESGDIPLPEIGEPTIKFTNKFSVVRQEFTIPSTYLMLASTSDVNAGINYKSSGQINVGAKFIGDAGITMGINNSNSNTSFDVSSDVEANMVYTFFDDVIVDGTTITNANFSAIEDGLYNIYPILLLSGNRRIGEKLGDTPKVIINANILGNICTIEAFTIPAGDYYSNSTDSSAVTSITIEILADRFKRR